MMKVQTRSFEAVRRTLALAGCVALLTACAGPPGDTEGDRAIGGATARAGGETGVAPDFTLEALDGRTITLSEMHGKIRLLDFWATWCAPCREEIPMLNDLQATFGDQGLEIIAISDEDLDVIREFVDEHDVRYTNLVGAVAVSESYGVLGLPTAYLLDGEGRIVESFLGPKPRKVLTEKIRNLLEVVPET
jgi:cytochrome c biogenesis protein CcmG/thiol:disulfide interchange protein DsbE